jgi:hypothetical protein
VAFIHGVDCIDFAFDIETKSEASKPIGQCIPVNCSYIKYMYMTNMLLTFRQYWKQNDILLYINTYLFLYVFKLLASLSTQNVDISYMHCKNDFGEFWENWFSEFQNSILFSFANYLLV